MRVIFVLLSIFLLLTSLELSAAGYTYDDVGRLRLVDYGGGNTQVYSYDSAGNIAEVKSTTTTDTTPDAFGFTAQTNVARSTLVTSAPVAIMGINAATNWSVTNGTACVGSSAANCGCADSAFATSGTVSNSQYVCARHTSSASYATKTTTTVTVGGVDGGFVSTTVVQSIDNKPDEFSFAAKTDVALSSVVESAAITVTGINAPASIKVSSGSFYRINGGTYVSAAGKVNNGDTVQVKHTSAATNNVSKMTTVTIGGVSAVFKSTTLAKDTTPDAFVFAGKTNVQLSSVVESAAITVTGINAPASIKVSSGSFYRINGGTYVSAAGKVNNGDTVQVKHTSAATNNVSKMTTVTIGGVSAVFKSTTLAKDTTPDAFVFAGKTNVQLSSVVESAAITVTGINAPASIKVSSGSFYRINGGTYVSAAGKVNNGDTVQVKHTSGATNNASKTTTLTIGGVAGTFKTTTLKAVTLAAPQNIVATAGNGKITLSWDAVAGATSYEVCRAQTSISDILDCTAFTGGTWHLDVSSPLNILGLTNGTKYYFRVLAKNANGFSPTSLQVDATPADGSLIPSLSIKFDQASLDALGASYYGMYERTKGYDDAENAVKFYGTGNPGHVRIPNRAEMQFTDGATFDVWTRIDSATGMNGYGHAATSGWAMAVLAKSHDRAGAALNTFPSPSGTGYGWTGMSTFDSTWQDGNCQISKQDFNVPLNTWFRLTMSISSTSGISAYVNKQLAYTCPNARPSFAKMNQQDLYIGKYSDSWYPLNGAVQYLNIYKQALTKTEVEALPHPMQMLSFTVNGKLVGNGGSLSGTVSDTFDMVLKVSQPATGIRMELPAPYGTYNFGNSGDGGITWNRKLQLGSVSGNMRLYPVDAQGNILPNIIPWVVKLNIIDPSPKLGSIGTWQQLEGKPFDVLLSGDDVENIVNVIAGSVSCSLIVGRSTSAEKLYTCTTPVADGIDGKPFTVTAMVNGNSVPWVRTSNYTYPSSYWEKYNGIPYVIGLDKYIASNGSGIGPEFSVNMGSTSGNLGDIPASSYFGALRLGSYICPKVANRDWVYQCPTLPAGVYFVDVLHDNNSRYLAGTSFIVQVK